MKIEPHQFIGRDRKWSSDLLRGLKFDLAQIEKAAEILARGKSRWDCAGILITAAPFGTPNETAHHEAWLATNIASMLIHGGKTAGGAGKPITITLNQIQ